MENIHNNLMKLGVSLGNVSQKMKNLIYFGLLVHFQEYNLVENWLTVRNVSSFYNKFFHFLWNVT
jgi:hypothetical protein